MKKIIFISLVVLFACKKKEDAAPSNDETPQSAMFYSIDNTTYNNLTTANMGKSSFGTTFQVFVQPDMANSANRCALSFFGFIPTSNFQGPNSGTYKVQSSFQTDTTKCVVSVKLNGAYYYSIADSGQVLVTKKSNGEINYQFSNVKVGASNFASGNFTY
ncbi:MAG: hypothetical protein J0M08_10625 [Bacteroidetes bacterium]|nr:hypothetical protein [Bacteroidota bacterium]